MNFSIKKKKLSTLFTLDILSKFSRLAFKKSANLFCCCCRGVSGFGGSFGDGGGKGVEFIGDGELLDECEVLLFELTDSKTGVKSTEGGLDGDLVGVELLRKGCEGGAILFTTVSTDTVGDDDV